MKPSNDMMKRGGVGGNSTRAAAARVGDDQDDLDLILFRDMQKRDKERNISLLQPIPSDDYMDSNSGNFPLFRMTSGKKFGFEFLNGNDKNDYDWLKTPPATPLFASLEMDAAASATDLVVQKELPILCHLSRFSGVPQQDVPSLKPTITMNSQPISPDPMKTASVVPLCFRGEHTRLTTRVNLAKENSNFYANLAKEEGAPQQKFKDPSKSTTQITKQQDDSDSAKLKTSPVTSWRRFSSDDDETPSNLITTNRSTSTSRTRPTTPSAMVILSNRTTRQPITVDQPSTKPRSTSTSRNRMMTTSLILTSTSQKQEQPPSNAVIVSSSTTTRGRATLRQQHAKSSNVFPTNHPKHKDTNSVTAPQNYSTIEDETSTPPNLITTNRPSSTSRTRPTTPSIKITNTNNPQQDPTSVLRSKRQSCSPSVSRGRRLETNNKIEGTQDSVITKHKNHQAAPANGSLAFGSSMVDKVINARKNVLAQESSEKLGTSTTINAHSGFGRLILSKSSVDVPNNHMDIRRDPTKVLHGGSIKSITTASTNTNLSSGTSKNTSLLQQGTKSIQESGKRKETRRFTAKS